MNKKELIEMLKDVPDDARVMILDPCENDYSVHSIHVGTCYECKDDDEENEVQVPAVYLLGQSDD